MLPLENIRILVTRTRDQASDLASRLEERGATVAVIPTIEIVPPESYAPLDFALQRLESYDWLLFTSANAVEVFAKRRNSSLVPRRIAVIGPATGKAVREIGLPVDLCPPKYIAESLAEALAPEASGKQILLVRAAEARDVIPNALAAAGASVTVVEAYRTQLSQEAIPALQQLFRSRESYPEAITFTSASTARNLFALLEAAGLALPCGVALASIGPITSQALRELGCDAIMEAAEPTLAALVDAMEQHFKS